MFPHRAIRWPVVMAVGALSYRPSQLISCSTVSTLWRLRPSSTTYSDFRLPIWILDAFFRRETRCLRRLPMGAASTSVPPCHFAHFSLCKPY